MRPARGFTLIEFLVAIGLFAVMSAMAYSALGQMLTARDRLDAERAYWAKLALVFIRMEEDFSQARARTVRNATGATVPAFIGRQTDTRALAPPVVEFTRGGVLLMPDTEGRSDLQRVGYRLSEGRLQRQTWPVLDLGFGAEPIESPVLDDVEDFQVRYLNQKGQWVNSWPSAGPANPLPRAVEVSLVLRQYGEIVRWWLVHD